MGTNLVLVNREEALEDGQSDTVEMLRDLLRQAQRGKLTGLAFVAVGQETFTLDYVGIARTDPTYMLGMLSRLQHEMNKYADTIGL